MASFQERLDAMKSGAPSAGAPATTNANIQQTTSASNDFQARLDAMKAGWTPTSTTYKAPEVLSTTTTKKEEEEKENLWERIKKLAGYTAESAASGAAEAVEGNINAVSDWLQRTQKSAMQQAAGGAALAAAFSNNPYVDEMAAKRQQEAIEAATTPTKVVANFGDKYSQKVADKYDAENMGFGGKLLGGVAQGVGQLAVDAAASVALPGVGGILSSFGSAYGNSVQEAKKNGADDLEAMAYGLGVGAVEAATEKLLGGMSFGKKGSIYGGGALDEIAKGIVKSKVSSPAVKVALNTVISGLGEGFEEFVSEFGSRLVDKLTIKQDNRNFGEAFNDAMYSALVGGIIGAIANTGDSIKAGKSTDPKTLAEQAANEAAEAINNKPQISPSTPTENQPTNVAPQMAAPNQGASGEANMGAEGVVNGADANYAAKDEVASPTDGIYDVSTGAAKIKQGQMVDTESKATTKSINLGEESREAVAPAQHEQISEALSLARAGANIMVDGEGNMVDFEGTVDDLLSREKWSGVDEDTAQLLLAEAEKRNDVQTIKRLAERIQTTNTEAAQLLQSTQKWIEKSPGGRLAAMYQLVAKYAKDHKAKKGKALEIPDELAQKYLAAQTEAERDAVIGEIQQHIADSTKPTFLDWWTALRYTNMLGNFKTQIRNISGNLVNKITYGIKDNMAAIIEAMSKSNRTKSVAVGREWMKAAKADYKNAEKRIFALGKYTGENFKGEFIEGIEKGRTILPPGFEQYRKATNWAMDTGDAIFTKSAYARSLAGFLKANGVKAAQLEGGAVPPELMEKAREYAVKQAQEQTFRDSNAFSDWVSRIGRREDTPKLAKVLSEGVAPFRRTPANIMVRAAEFSPAGLVKGAYDAATAKKRDISASDVIDELSKGLTGTLLLGLGALLGKAGLLRGSGNEEEDDIDALMNRQDWSIIIPGVGSYTIDWAAPTTLPLFVGAQLMAALDGEGLTVREIEQVFYSVTEPIVAMSMLNGIEDTLNNAKYSDNNMMQLLASSALSYVTQGLTNTLLGQVERVFEPERMSTYADKMKDLPDWLQRGIGKASAKLPGLDYNQTEYLNEFGETESSGNVGARIFENLFSPGYFEASKEGEKAYDFVQDMYDRFGIDAVPTAYPEGSIDVKGVEHQLTQEQKNQYQEVRGQTIKEFYEALDSNKAFSRLGGEDAGAVISTLMSYANKKAKYEVATDMGLDMERTAKEQVYDDMTPSQYIEYLVLGERTPIAATYKSKPEWQQYEQAIKTLPTNLAIDMIYAGSEVNGKKFEAAVNAGVSLEDALAYYKALIQRTPNGEAPTAGEKSKRIRELGLSFDVLRALDIAWETKKD